jgi:hypothetical protein
LVSLTDRKAAANCALATWRGDEYILSFLQIQVLAIGWTVNLAASGFLLRSQWRWLLYDKFKFSFAPVRGTRNERKGDLVVSHKPRLENSKQ